MSADTHSYPDPLDRLVDYALLYLSRLTKKHLQPEERQLLRYIKQTGDLSPVVAEALKLMSQDGHSGDDVAELSGGRPRALDQEDAIRLKREHGSLTKVAELTGISRSALYRAYTGSYGGRAG